MSRENNTEFPGIVESWNGYKLHRFPFHGTECRIVVPSCPVPGKKWFWRAKFFNAFPGFDLAMVRKGFYFVHIEISNAATVDDAVLLMNDFYQLLTEEFQFDKRCVMEAYCTGAACALKWGASHPESIAALFLDNPVLGEENWNTISGKLPVIPAGPDSVENEDYPLTGGDLDLLPYLAAAGIPIRLVYSRSDHFCSVQTHANSIFRIYRNFGGKIELLEHKGNSHGPHSMDNPENGLIFAASVLHAEI